MLQKSKSKTVSKLKFLFILPLMVVMLTYVTYSNDLLVPEDEETHSTETLGHQDQEIDDIPFAIIEEVPLFPGCEALATNEDRKNCMTTKVTDIVRKNFNTSLGKQNGLGGVNRVYVKFKISKDGKVEVLETRTPHPALQEEAERVVNLLPQMIPGKQNGEEVGVLYFLPIIFRSNNDQ